MSKNKLRNIFKSSHMLLLQLTCVILILVHGYQKTLEFVIDYTTLILLAVVAFPLITKYIDILKRGDWELRFRSLTFLEQNLLFLEAIANKELWTFYHRKRDEESHLGDAFRILVGSLIEKEQSKFKLINTLKKWLKSEEGELQWLASEIVGYFQINELKDNLRNIYKNIDKNQQWTPWQLNCLWAHSRFENYQEMHELLLTTKNEQNQEWLLVVYSQMPIVNHALPQEFIQHLNKFTDRDGIKGHVKEKANEIKKELEQLIRANPSCIGT